MKAYKVKVFDKKNIPTFSLIDNLLVVANGPKQAIAKAEAYAKKEGWTNIAIREVYELPETVVP